MNNLNIYIGTAIAGNVQTLCLPLEDICNTYRDYLIRSATLILNPEFPMTFYVYIKSQIAAKFD